jgi:DNA-binding GntR family transcriptional regulator
VTGTGLRVPAPAQAQSGTDGSLAAYRTLREAIVDGRLHPNERLVEADLAKLLSAGRTTVRAALVRLEQEGLVEREPNRGARVRRVSDREALEIEEVRVSLEQLMARHAALNLTPEGLADLRAMLEEMTTHVESGDPVGYSELNARFHSRIWALADLGVAERMLVNLKSQSIRFQYRTILQPGRPERSLREHTRIVEALASRNPDASEAAMRDHMSQVVATLKSAIARQTAP